MPAAAEMPWRAAIMRMPSGRMELLNEAKQPVFRIRLLAEVLRTARARDRQTAALTPHESERRSPA
jgi:hypothetical protein